ncbi:unnamed protein product [Amoebophrya sp. A120]|nr:unnamed protein product [Amoebophrya sp. A120]|eukprot:GSA120T00023831001.1
MFLIKLAWVFKILHLVVHCSLRAASTVDHDAKELFSHHSLLRKAFVDRLYGGRDLLAEKELPQHLLDEKTPNLEDAVDDRFSDGTWRTHLEKADVDLVTRGLNRPVKFWLELGSFRGQSCIRAARILKNANIYYHARRRKLQNGQEVEQESRKNTAASSPDDDFFVLCVDSFVFGSSFVSTLVEDLKRTRKRKEKENKVESKGTSITGSTAVAQSGTSSAPKRSTTSTSVLDQMLYKDGSSKLLDQFIANVRHAGLEQVIAVWPQTTLSALRLLLTKVQPPASLPLYDDDSEEDNHEIRYDQEQQLHEHEEFEEKEFKGGTSRPSEQQDREKNPSTAAALSSAPLQKSKSRSFRNSDKEPLLPIQPDVIYLDASHLRDETLMEVEHAWAALAPGGILFGDDWALEEVAVDVLKFVDRLLLCMHKRDELPRWTSAGDQTNANATIAARTASGTSSVSCANFRESSSLDVNWFPHQFYEHRVGMLRPGLYVSRDTFQWFLRKHDPSETQGRRLQNRFELVFHQAPTVTEATSEQVDLKKVKWLDHDSMFVRGTEEIVALAAAHLEGEAETHQGLAATARTAGGPASVWSPREPQRHHAYLQPLRPHILGMFLESDLLLEDPILTPPDGQTTSLPTSFSFLDLQMTTCFLGFSAVKVKQWQYDCCQDWSEENSGCWDLVYNPNHCCVLFADGPDFYSTAGIRSSRTTTRPQPGQQLLRDTAPASRMITRVRLTADHIR